MYNNVFLWYINDMNIFDGGKANKCELGYIHIYFPSGRFPCKNISLSLGRISCITMYDTIWIYVMEEGPTIVS